jgi:hypothetical protein
MVCTVWSGHQAVASLAERSLPWELEFGVMALVFQLAGLYSFKWDPFGAIVSQLLSSVLLVTWAVGLASAAQPLDALWRTGGAFVKLAAVVLMVRQWFVVLGTAKQ